MHFDAHDVSIHFCHDELCLLASSWLAEDGRSEQEWSMAGCMRSNIPLLTHTACIVGVDESPAISLDSLLL
jgi:hypothetical protein